MIGPQNPERGPPPRSSIGPQIPKEIHLKSSIGPQIPKGIHPKKIDWPADPERDPLQ